MPGIAFGQHDVVEVERMLAERGDVDNARRRACLQQGKQQAREQKAGKVVDGEPQFVAVGTELALDPGDVDPMPALLMKTSSRLCPAITVSASFRAPASDDKSAW